MSAINKDMSSGIRFIFAKYIVKQMKEKIYHLTVISTKEVVSAMIAGTVYRGFLE